MSLIDYKNATIFHDDGEMVLENINFSVNEGEFIYIIGKVGSGKSSLLRSCYYDIDIDSDEKAEVLGRDMRKLKRKDLPKLRRELGIIFQDFKLLHDRSVEKNLEFVLTATGWKKADMPGRIDEVLKSVGMENSKNKKPHELSGGEQQRIAIARALLNSPKIILADEPTGNLDPQTADNIIALLRDITNSGTAVIITTHNIPMLDKFPGIVYQCENHHIKDVTRSV